MSSKRKPVVLEDVIEAFIDYRGKTPKKKDRGIPLITAKIIKNGFIHPVQEYIAEEDYDSWMTRGIPQKNDVILTTEAPLGEVALLNTSQRVAFAQRVIVLRGKQGIVDNIYLKYLIQSPIMQSKLSERASGSTVLGIKSSELKKINFSLPNYSEQLKVAGILKAIDDKIELNNAINKNLEEIAQAFFKRWFIDFEFPNENGEPYKSSGGKLVESELGLIPKGWKVNKLDSLCSINTSSINPSKNKEATFEHYSIPSFDAGAFPVFDKGRDIKSNKYKVINNSILLSKLNPQTKRLWVPLILTENAVSSTEFINYIPKDSEIKGFLYSILDSEVFQNYICSNTTGSTNSRQRISPQQTLNFQFPCPNNSRLIYQFSDMINQIIKKMQTVLLENIKLSAIRDTLLPKLMSGEIRVPIDEQGLTSINE